jgi:hypothetical protein
MFPQNLMGFASEAVDVEDFLAKHSESVDLNEYNDDGRTALQQSCFDGNLQLAQVKAKTSRSIKHDHKLSDRAYPGMKLHTQI